MPNLAITDAQAAFFHANGYLILRGFLHSEEFSRLRQGVDNLTEYGKLGVHADPDFLYGTGDKTGKRVLRRIEYVVDKSDACKVLLGHPYILRSVERLIGRDFVPTWDSLVAKLPAEGVEVPWHRDASPFHVGDAPIFTVAFYLDRADQDTCLWVLPGSHLWKQSDVDQIVARPVFSTDGATPLLMDPGDVAFHHVLLLHGSRANHTPKTRRVLYYEFRSARVEAELGPHTPEYIPLKQRVLINCIARRRAAPYVSRDEVPYDYDPPAPWTLTGVDVPLASLRIPHEAYWRSSESPEK